MRGDVELFISGAVLAEVREVAGRPRVGGRFGITQEQINRLIENISKVAVSLGDVPSLYEHPYDPDDSHYINLALAAYARLVVSRDHDLLNLMDSARPEGQAFLQRFGHMRIVEPTTLLQELRE